MTDPNIALCPSSATNTADDFTTSEGVNYFGTVCENGGDGARLMDEDYLYLGWVFDKGDCLDPVVELQSVDPVLSGLGLDATGSSEDTSAQLAAWLIALGTGVATSADANELNQVSDQDLDVGAAIPDTGNGTGGTLYRLREGIERFLITDINNPAQSAQAQSTVHIMYDYISTQVQDFNHIPGGANVLFLDGHVEFIRYIPGNDCGGEQPVNPYFARMVGALINQ